MLDPSFPRHLIDGVDWVTDLGQWLSLIVGELERLRI